MPRVSKPFDNEAVGGMDTDHVEPFVTDGGKAMRCFRSDHDNVAGTGNGHFAADGYCHPAGADDASFGIRMLMQSRALSGLEIAEEKETPASYGAPSNSTVAMAPCR